MRALRPGRSLEPGRTTLRFLTLRAPSISCRCHSAVPLRPGHLQRMIDACLHGFAKSHRMRQPRVNLECLFLPPFRVNVKQAPIANRTEGVNPEAARLVPRRSKHPLEGLGRLPFLPLERVRLRNDVDFRFPPPGTLRAALPKCSLSVRAVATKSNYFHVL